MQAQPDLRIPYCCTSQRCRPSRSPFGAPGGRKASALLLLSSLGRSQAAQPALAGRSGMGGGHRGKRSGKGRNRKPAARPQDAAAAPTRESQEAAAEAQSSVQAPAPSDAISSVASGGAAGLAMVHACLYLHCACGARPSGCPAACQPNRPPIHAGVCAVCGTDHLAAEIGSNVGDYVDLQYAGGDYDWRQAREQWDL